MLSLIWPWMLALAPLPFLYRWWRKPADDAQAALLAPVYAQLAADSENSPAVNRSNGPSLSLLTLIWLACLLAASRPQWIGEPIALPTSGRDLLLAVDISPSMADKKDMYFNGSYFDRLTAAKAVVGDFAKRRSGDRLGLILFGDEAYLQSPLTFDRQTINTLLQEAIAGFAGKGTAIGDAIGLGVKRLKDKKESSHVIVLLTDGENNAGEVEPLKAAELAAAYGVKVYTIGISRITPYTSLDETTLKTIAKRTGGQYFRAQSPKELMQIYATLDQLEPVSQDAETFRPTRALFYWPLGVALLLSCLLLLLRGRKA